MSSEPDSKGTGFKYWAFLSYSHQDNLETRKDGTRNRIRWAEWLHDSLEHYRVPTHFRDRATPTGEPMPERFFPVFQDEKELPINANLGESIRKALEQAPFLIVICSPRSAVSRYVNEEVRYFKALGRQNRIMTLMIDGEPNASVGNKPGYTAADECFCPALRFSIDARDEVDTSHSDAQEPIAGDVRVKDAASAREATRGDLSSHGPMLEYMKLKLIAGLMGVGFDELAQRDKVRVLEEARTKARRARRIAAVVAGLALLAIVFAFFAFQQKKNAQRETERALAAEQTAKEKTAEVVRNLSRADFIAADEAIKVELKQQALARLARAVRGDPHNSAAGRRLLFLLLLQPWFVPAPPGATGVDLPSRPVDPNAVARRTSAKAMATKRLGKDAEEAIVAVSDSGSAVAIARSQRIEWLDNPPASESRSPFDVEFRIEALAFSPDEERIVAVGGFQDEYSHHGDVVVLRKDGKPAETHGLDRFPVHAVEFSPDDSLFVSAGFWWDVYAHPLGSFYPENETKIAFSADGRTVMMGGSSWVQLGRQPISKPLGEDPADHSTVLDENLPPNTRYSISFAGEGNIGGTLTDERNGHTVQLPAVWIINAAFHPDGQRILLVMHDKSARLWDVATGAWASEAIILRDTESEAAFAPDGSCFATSSTDGAGGWGDFQLWDTETMRPLTRRIDGTEIFGSGDAPLGPFRFTPSWQLLFSAAPEGEKKIAQYFALDVPHSDEPVPGWLADLAEAVAGLRLTTRGVFVRIDTATLWQTVAAARAITERGDDTWSATIRWWLDESAEQTISPRSTVKVVEYVKRRLASAKLYDLVVAGRAAPKNAEVFERLAAVAAQEEYAKGIALSASRRALWLRATVTNANSQVQSPKNATASDAGESEFARGDALRKAGGEENEREALACYRRAVEMGHVPAMHRIGVMYALGLGGLAPDRKKAVEWYRKAADKNFAEAQYDLGICYIKGLGVNKSDEATGLDLCRKAAAQGWQDAIEMLRQRDASRR